MTYPGLKEDNPFSRKPKLAEFGTFGWYLRQIREKRGLSQSKLAEFGDFDHSYVSRLEAGTRMPTRDAVIRLARAMELPEGDERYEKLLDLAGFRTLRGTIHFASAAIKELNEEYRLMSPAMQQQIDGYIGILVDGAKARRNHEQ